MITETRYNSSEMKIYQFVTAMSPSSVHASYSVVEGCVCVSGSCIMKVDMMLFVPRVPILATVAQEQLEVPSVKVPSQCPVRELKYYITLLDIQTH